MNWDKAREQLVKILRAEGINNQAVLEAIAKTPRHLFIDPQHINSAYENHPITIGYGQTISQPFVVARMTELLLQDSPIKKVLEIGTGSGYQAALLSELVDDVYTIERIEALYLEAKQRLEAMRYTNIHVRYGDGREGWPEQAPFDGIIVTAGAMDLPDNLLKQLADGGRLVIPVGERISQRLLVITRNKDKFITDEYDPVIFVPLLPGKE
jgi:protein-L-isoaspartate(D-aspartate) O-methyltransferase